MRTSTIISILIGAIIIITAILFATGTFKSDTQTATTTSSAATTTKNEITEQAATPAPTTSSASTPTTTKPTTSSDINPSWKTYSGSLQISTANSVIGWTGKKSLIPSWVDTGTVKVKEGSVVFKNGVAVSGKAVADLSTISVSKTGKNGGFEQLANHLKSPAFFDTAKYPTSTFTINSFTPTNKKDEYRITGTLEIKGISNPVEFVGTIVYTDTKATLTARAELDRTKWGVNFGSSKLADAFISDTFSVDISAVVLRK